MIWSSSRPVHMTFSDARIAFRDVYNWSYRIDISNGSMVPLHEDFVVRHLSAAEIRVFRGIQRALRASRDFVVSNLNTRSVVVLTPIVE